MDGKSVVGLILTIVPLATMNFSTSVGNVYVNEIVKRTYDSLGLLKRTIQSIVLLARVQMRICVSVILQTASA